MHIAHLSLHDFRSYAEVDVPLQPGVTAFVGPNGQGKTNLVEAVDYVATLGSHRVGSDTPLVRIGADRAIVRVDAVRDSRHLLAEVEISPGKANRARINRSPVGRTRELLGLVRTVLFSPEDLALAKGDPSERRRFLDDLLVVRAPRLAGVRQDYDRVLKQRNTLLKTAGAARRGQRRDRRGGSGSEEQGSALGTLEVWDDHLAQAGAELLAARLGLVEAIEPYVAACYAKVAAQAASGRAQAALRYKASWDMPDTPARDVLAAALRAELARRRDDELERGISLVGPHRDDLMLSIGDMPAKGYASHGESWSFALALRLAAYELLRADGDDPVLILDDVFAELDGDRRDRLAELVSGAEQVLVTAAVPQDVPEVLDGARFDVAEGEVRRVR
ncbi:MAG TPA: DNA replication/repair protein RecF [Nocardioidaceae bacterium]|nr:DNA replication/repair protein RecF [Nocardioidaceae bacterium]